MSYDDLFTPDGVMKNKLGLQTREELRAAEYAITHDKQMAYLSRDASEFSFDSEHIKDIHRFLFEEIYEWAGQTRNETLEVEGEHIALGDNFQKVSGAPFTAASRVDESLTRLSDAIADSPQLLSSDKAIFADNLAHVLIRFIPFLKAMEERKSCSSRSSLIALAMILI